MVKGISRQVIVVRGPEERLFEQAIFILKDSAVGQGVTGDVLMKEAEGAIRGRTENRRPTLGALLWAGAGALAVGLVWLLTALF